MVRWDLKDEHPATDIGKIVRKHLGDLDGQNVDRMLSAYSALWKGKFRSADEIRKSFTNHGKPLFTLAEAKEVFNKIRKKVVGGVGDSASILNETAEKMIDTASGVAPPSTGLPPAAQDAINNSIRFGQSVLRVVLPFVFILKTLENSPMFGDLIGASLDIFTAGIGPTANAIEAVTPAIVGLAPLPEAGEVGILLGWLFSLVVLWTGAVVSLSRKDFANALKFTAGMVPIMGPSLADAVQNGNTVGTKLYNRSTHIMDAISNAYGSVQGAVEKVKTLPMVQTAMAKAQETRNAIATNPTYQDIKSKVINKLQPSPSPPPIPTTGGRFTRRKRSVNKKKWRRTTKRRQ